MFITETLTFPYTFTCSYAAEILGEVSVTTRVTNKLVHVSEKTFTLELHQPINGLQIALSKEGQPADVAQVLEPIDLRIEVEEGSHMDIIISYGDDTDAVHIETNGTKQIFTRIHQFQKAGDLTVCKNSPV